MNKLIQYYQVLFTLVSGLLAGCGATSLGEQKLTVEMLGVYTAPEGATGNRAPRSVEFDFSSIVLLTESGTTALNDVETTDLTVIDRPQIIFTQDISDYDKQAFTGVQMAFGTSIVVKGRSSTETLTLDPSTITDSTGFTVETGKGVTVTLEVNWRNTITFDETTSAETITAPTIQSSTKVE